MRKTKLILLGFTFLSVMPYIAEAKVSLDEKKDIPATAQCSPVGELSCPKGLKPKCPEQYRPSCVFIGNMQLPSCLADNSDDTFYNFDLNKISCGK